MRPDNGFLYVWKNELAWCTTHIQQVICLFCMLLFRRFPTRALSVDVWTGQETIFLKYLAAQTLICSDFVSSLRSLHLRRCCFGWLFGLVLEQCFEPHWPECHGSHDYVRFFNTTNGLAAMICSIGCRLVWIARFGTFQHGVSIFIVLVWIGEYLLACAANCPRYSWDFYSQRNWVALVF